MVSRSVGRIIERLPGRGTSEIGYLPEFVRRNRVPVPDGVSGLQFRPAAPDASAGNEVLGGGKMLSGVTNVYDFLQGIVR